jgi:hypothetical protein
LVILDAVDQRDSIQIKDNFILTDDSFRDRVRKYYKKYENQALYIILHKAGPK